jgi:DNA-binding response OmpR family regulator
MERALNILVVEDDPHVADVVEYALRAESYLVQKTNRGAAAIAICTGTQRPDILILDVGLPDIDGFEVCRTIRRVSDLPVLFLTSRTDEINRVVGLEIGGDDYLTKPFSPRELLARIKVVRRHLAALERRTNGEPGSGESPNVVRHGSIELDRARFLASCEGAVLRLTRQEFRILDLLLSAPGRVFTREEVLDRAWDDGGTVTDRAIDAHVKALRRKLGSAATVIETVRGIGYRARE